METIRRTAARSSALINCFPAPTTLGLTSRRAKEPRADFWSTPPFADELETLLHKANRSMEELQATLHNLQLTSSSLQLTSTNLPGISEALSNEAKDLPGLVLQTQSSMRELERLVEGMQRHWFLRKYMNATNAPAVRR